MKKLLIFILLFFILILWIDFFMSSWFYYNLDTVFYPIDNLSNFFSRTAFFHFWDIWMLVNYKIFSKLFLILCLCLWAFLWYKLANYLINNFIIINSKHNFIASNFFNYFYYFKSFYLWKVSYSNLSSFLNIFHLNLIYIFTWVFRKKRW